MTGGPTVTSVFVEAAENLPQDENGVTVTCRCGREVPLYWNGGELDSRDCPCGRDYSLRARGYQVFVTEPARYVFIGWQDGYGDYTPALPGETADSGPGRGEPVFVLRPAP